MEKERERRALWEEQKKIGFSSHNFFQLLQMNGVDRLLLSFLCYKSKEVLFQILINSQNFKDVMCNRFNIKVWYMIRDFDYCFEMKRKIMVTDDKGGKEHKIWKECTRGVIKVLSLRWDFYHPAIYNKGVQEIIHTFCKENELIPQFTILFVKDEAISFLSGFTSECYDLDIQPLTFFFETCAKRHKAQIRQYRKRRGPYGWGAILLPLCVEKNWQNVIDLTMDDDATS